MARGDEFTFAADQRAVVDAKLHLQSRRIDLGEGQGVASFIGTDGVADIDVLNAGDADNVTGARARGFGGAEASEFENLTNFSADAFAVRVTYHENGITKRGGAAENLTNRDTTHIIAPINIGYEHMERLIRFSKRRRNVIEDRLEEWAHVLLLVAKMKHHVTVTA